MSSKESLSFEDRQAKKRERRRREELRNFTIGVFVAGALGLWLHNVGIIDNPFELHQDTSVSVEDNTADK
jgi:hypothetical protein